MMKDVGIIPSHLIDKDVSFFNELESSKIQLSHDRGQSLLQLELSIPYVVPTPNLSDTLKYTKIQI